MKYSEKLCIEAFEIIVGSGMNNTDLCDYLEISSATFYAWTNKGCKEYKPKFAEYIQLARRESKKFRKQEALESLRKCALGYEYEESVTEYLDGKEVKKTVKRKHRPADIQAITHLLGKSSEPLDASFI